MVPRTGPGDDDLASQGAEVPQPEAVVERETLPDGRSLLLYTWPEQDD